MDKYMNDNVLKVCRQLFTITAPLYISCQKNIPPPLKIAVGENIICAPKIRNNYGAI